MSKTPAAIGRYEVVSRLGQGGMGYLYLAWDPMLDRQIAIKVLRDDNDELRERFAREARSVAKLRHPNIVTIFDVGEQDGQPFIAMEYIQGQTLGELIKGKAPVSVVRKLEILEELCDGLGFAHKAAIVHRDIKPANVMVENEGAVKVLDFGIARIAESGMTQAGMLIGTLNYMSPEQVSGQMVDGRSDIFAVGTLMYELLSLRQAFPGGLQNGILHRILHEAPAPLSVTSPWLDEEVVRIVERAMHKDPEHRYQDLAAMRKDVHRAHQRLVLSEPETLAVTASDSDETRLLDAPPIVRRPPTPRRGTDREALAKRRAAQVSGHLDVARRALAAGALETAVSEAEQALMLDNEDASAADIIERARAALDERQAQTLVTQGQEQLSAGDVTAALALADHALALAPNLNSAVALQAAVGAARDARERERLRVQAVKVAVERGHELLRNEAFAEAEAAAAEALALSPDQADALELQGRARAGSARQRQQAIDERAAAARDEARRMFADGQHDAALEALAAFRPVHDTTSEALAELRRQKVAIERSRSEAEALRQREARVAEALRRAGDEPSHATAIGVLQTALGVDADHRDLHAQLEVRQAALEVEHDLERRREQERLSTIAAAEEKTRQEEARKREAEARQREADARKREAEAKKRAEEDARRREHEERQRAEAAKRREEEARRREAEKVAAVAAAITAAIASARTTASHEEAIPILRKVLELDPQHAELRREIAARQDALDRAQAELQREAERRERVAAAIARAGATTSHHDAVALLEEAAALDPANRQIGPLLETRRVALAKEREAARLVRERDAHIADTVRKAGAASHEEAIVLLTGALALDPTHREAKRQLEARQTALARERAEAERRSGIDAARVTVADLLARHAFDGAAQALDQAEQSWQAKKELKDLRRQLARAKRAAAGGTAWNFRSPIAVAGMTAIALILLVGGYRVMRPAAPAAPAAPSAVPASRVPVESSDNAAADIASRTTTPPVPEPSPASPVEAPPSEAPVAEAPVAAAPVAPAPAAAPPVETPTVAPAVATAVEQARRHIARAEWPQAMATIAGGLKSDPGNRDLNTLAVDVVARVRRAATAARTAAAARGDLATGTTAYTRALANEAAAGRDERAGRRDQAVRQFMDAAGSFAQADREAVAAAARVAAAPPVSTPAQQPQPTPTTPVITRSDPPAPPPTSSGTTPSMPPSAPPTAPAPVPSQEAAIRATLRGYEAAYRALDANAVRSVYPSVNAAALDAGFRLAQSQQVQILNEQIVVEGTTATVRGRWRQTFTPKRGSGRTDETGVTLRLQRVGDRWIIVDRR